MRNAIPRKRTFALFVAPFCAQAIVLLAFMRRGDRPLEAAVDAMLAMVPLAVAGAAYASFGARVGALSPEGRTAMQGFCFASAAIAPFALLGVFVSASSGGIGATTALAACMGVPYLVAILGIAAQAVAGMTGVSWRVAALAISLQAAALAALVIML